MRHTHTIPTLINDANAIAQDQTTSDASPLVLNGALGTAKIGSGFAQKISIEGAGDNSGVTFTIVGEDADGNTQTEDLVGGAGAAVHSVLYYRNPSTITPDGAITGNVEVGYLSAQGAVSSTIIPEKKGYEAPMAIMVDITGTMTLTVDHTFNNVASPGEPKWFDTSGLTGISADAESNVVLPISGLRARITSYTSGSADLLTLQNRGT